MGGGDERAWAAEVKQDIGVEVGMGWEVRGS